MLSSESAKYSLFFSFTCKIQDSPNNQTMEQTRTRSFIFNSIRSLLNRTHGTWDNNETSHTPSADPEPTAKFTKVFKRKYIQQEITSSCESQKRQVMPAPLKIMLGLQNNVKNYASTRDNSLPTCIEICFEKPNVFNYASCIHIVSK